MATIYTINGKVLKNVTTDKWLAKKEAPAGFVMNGSNATLTSSGGLIYVSWQSPGYPDGYNGNGKQFTIVNNNGEANGSQLMYTSSSTGSGPDAISSTDMRTLGTSTGVMSNNVAGGTYGAYLTVVLSGTLEQAQAYVANLSITIADP